MSKTHALHVQAAVTVRNPKDWMDLPMESVDETTTPKALNTSRTKILELVKNQLKTGKKIPWYWRNYGRYVVETMFKQSEPVSRRRNPTKLKAPTK